MDRAWWRGSFVAGGEQGGGVGDRGGQVMGDGLKRARAAALATRKPKLTEAAFTAQVIQFAQLMGWRVAHFRPAMTSKGWRTPVQGDGAGFPDLVMVRRGVVVFAELKTDTGKISDQQWRWLCDLRECGLWAWLWRPKDWQTIESFLTGTEAEGDVTGEG